MKPKITPAQAKLRDEIEAIQTAYEHAYTRMRRAIAKMERCRTQLARTRKRLASLANDTSPKRPLTQKATTMTLQEYTTLLNALDPTHCDDRATASEVSRNIRQTLWNPACIADAKLVAEHADAIAG
jgi:hypothetical protein